ncbi:MAG: nitroreductase family protein [Gammaproteobacteria bacterium]|nr:nitroreductase family protein [Gammaproteobacteria bacterium]
MWDFFETVRHRHSVRRYLTDREVEPQQLHAILEMACAAPSAGDLQSYRIVVVQDGAMRDALAQAADNQTFISEAPICLVFCADTERAEVRFGERGRSLYAVQDATIAAAYAQLAVVAANLGSTWVGYFDEAEIARLLNLPAGMAPIALLSIGYPAELPELSPRRPLGDVVDYR